MCNYCLDPSFDLDGNSHCSGFSDTGAKTMWFTCKVCAIEPICKACIRKCHTTHEHQYLPGIKSAFCYCATSMMCCAAPQVEEEKIEERKTTIQQFLEDSKRFLSIGLNQHSVGQDLVRLINKITVHRGDNIIIEDSSETISIDRRFNDQSVFFQRSGSISPRVKDVKKGLISKAQRRRKSANLNTSVSSNSITTTTESEATDDKVHKSKKFRPKKSFLQIDDGVSTQQLQYFSMSTSSEESTHAFEELDVPEGNPNYLVTTFRRTDSESSEEESPKRLSIKSISKTLKPKSKSTKSSHTSSSSSHSSRSKTLSKSTPNLNNISSANSLSSPLNSPIQPTTSTTSTTSVTKKSSILLSVSTPDLQVNTSNNNNYSTLKESSSTSNLVSASKQRDRSTSPRISPRINQTFSSPSVLKYGRKKEKEEIVNEDEGEEERTTDDEATPKSVESEEDELGERKKLENLILNLLEVCFGELKLDWFEAKKEWNQTFSEKNVSEMDLQDLLNMYFISLGEFHFISKLLKAASSQGVIAPVWLFLKSLIPELNFIDKSNTWRISINFTSAHVIVNHEKTQTNLARDFEFTWQYSLLFKREDITLTKVKFNVMRLNIFSSLDSETYHELLKLIPWYYSTNSPSLIKRCLIIEKEKKSVPETPTKIETLRLNIMECITILSKIVKNGQNDASSPLTQSFNDKFGEVKRAVLFIAKLEASSVNAEKPIIVIKRAQNNIVLVLGRLSTEFQTILNIYTTKENSKENSILKKKSKDSSRWLECMEKIKPILAIFVKNLETLS